MTSNQEKGFVCERCKNVIHEKEMVFLDDDKTIETKEKCSQGSFVLCCYCTEDLGVYIPYNINNIKGEK